MRLSIGVKSSRVRRWAMCAYCARVPVICEGGVGVERCKVKWKVCHSRKVKVKYLLKCNVLNPAYFSTVLFYLNTK